jgi:hypothetical protein
MLVTNNTIDVVGMLYLEQFIGQVTASGGGLLWGSCLHP